ncbi:MAG TPA: hypothetical protein VK524_26885 [Polyangiaceae bacterium]|nr:hypothetical protein [Polyangiaceae bacterium]
MYRFDKSQWPIVIVTHDSSHTDEDFDAYLRGLEGLFTSGERYAYVDVMPASMTLPPFARIKRFISWFREHRDEADHWCVGAASVIPNAAARGAATFFVQVTKSATPRYFAKDLQDALDWARTQLAANAPRAERDVRNPS